MDSRASVSSKSVARSRKRYPASFCQVSRIVPSDWKRSASYPCTSTVVWSSPASEAPSTLVVTSPASGV